VAVIDNVEKKTDVSVGSRVRESSPAPAPIARASASMKGGLFGDRARYPNAEGLEVPHPLWGGGGTIPTPSPCEVCGPDRRRPRSRSLNPMKRQGKAEPIRAPRLWRDRSPFGIVKRYGGPLSRNEIGVGSLRPNGAEDPRAWIGAEKPRGWQDDAHEHPFCLSAGNAGEFACRGRALFPSVRRSTRMARPGHSQWCTSFQAIVRCGLGQHYLWRRAEAPGPFIDPPGRGASPSPEPCRRRPSSRGHPYAVSADLSGRRAPAGSRYLRRSPRRAPILHSLTKPDTAVLTAAESATRCFAVLKKSLALRGTNCAVRDHKLHEVTAYHRPVHDSYVDCPAPSASLPHRRHRRARSCGRWNCRNRQFSS